MGVLTAALPLLVLATMAAPSALAGQGDLSDDEINTMAGVGQHEPFSEDDRFGERILEAIQREPIANNGARATYTDKAYGDHPRNRFDLWIAEAEADDAARPLVVFVHGGGFQRGDKALLYDSSVLVELLEAGISVAGVNYRF